MLERRKINIPAYSGFVYAGRYDSLPNSEKLDTKLSSRMRTFFQYDRLVESALAHIKMNEDVLQMGLVFGNEIDQVAQRVGAYGRFDVIDFNPLQVSRCKEKYGHVYPCLNIFEHDAAVVNFEKQYDVVLCFLLLQELPPRVKAKVINNALNAVKEGGRAIFVDYHKPLYWHPLRYFVRMHNRLKHPFAEGLWKHDIDAFAQNRHLFSWKKSTYFGRMFQKVVATRKDIIKNTIAPVQEENTELSYF